jgi:tartrate dehydrogenase/decarboxylase/D-malate dehydrogenase
MAKRLSQAALARPADCVLLAGAVYAAWSRHPAPVRPHNNPKDSVMKNYKPAFIPGDGVGPEVAAETRKVLQACADRFNFSLAVASFAWDCDYYLKHGKMMPDDGLETLRAFDAIFLGSVGDPSRVPDNISLTSLLAIRKGFDQYVNLRPILLHEGVSSPVAGCTPATVNMVVVRENTEGEYSRIGGFHAPDAPHGFASQTAVFSPCRLRTGDALCL